ncbi:response regulator transcription factor [Actinomycetospora endophytica]|uniref:Response regulator transcription factor n=1 Tax=Actinomycetospora endophytica TaxID=2291215 RepID=A0ABS8PCU6_9PSEU|nr:response regulator transcription factor [Actinomycetospora endophytica]MCD2196103.1 response regulator transcription factor [Actinomycetospora endophytica]
MGDPTDGEGPPGADDRCPVLIIDDHELFSATLGIALRGEGLDASMLLVADVPEFLSRPTVCSGGLVVLDLDLGRGSDGRAVHGVDLVEPLRSRGWAVLVVTGSADDAGIAAALAHGAVGHVPKSSTFATLLSTVAAAARGSTVMSETERLGWLERHRRGEAQHRELARRLARLTPREREVLELLGAGMRASAIAERFVVTLPTVRTQIRSILSKLEVGSQLEAVAQFRRSRIPSGVTERDS